MLNLSIAENQGVSFGERLFPIDRSFRIKDFQLREHRTLAFWQIVETIKGARHCAGWNVDTGRGHVSAVIVALDVQVVTATAEAGVTYQLRGNPGLNMDAASVLGQWSGAFGTEAHVVPYVESTQEK